MRELIDKLDSPVVRIITTLRTELFGSPSLEKIIANMEPNEEHYGSMPLLFWLIHSLGCVNCNYYANFVLSHFEKTSHKEIMSTNFSVVLEMLRQKAKKTKVR
ncbi:MAG: hypothetical protein ACOZAO_04335 [Patescibacteria group bacterium]